MRRICRYAFLIFLLLPTPAAVFAQRDRDTYSPNNQSFEVAGQINITSSNAAGREIPVRLERFSGGIIDQMPTDARGRFRFGNLQRGYYRVIVSAPGFAPAQQDADLTLLSRVYLVFTLTEVSSSLPTANLAIDVRVPDSAREEFTRAREALAKKNKSAALDHLRKATSIYPEFEEAQYFLAMVYMDLREWQQAEAAFERCLQIHPDNVATLLGLGEVYWREKRFADAEKTLREALRIDGNSWLGHFTLARLYFEQNQTVKAAPEIGRTLQLKPDFAEAHLLAGNILLNLNQRERAIVEYQEYLRLAPKGEFATQTRELIQKLQFSFQ